AAATVRPLSAIRRPCTRISRPATSARSMRGSTTRMPSSRRHNGVRGVVGSVAQTMARRDRRARLGAVLARGLSFIFHDWALGLATVLLALLLALALFGPLV